jgi:hypothetical protein
MNVGMLFWVLALLFFFAAGTGMAFVPNPIAWGLFCLTLGLLTAGIPLWPPRTG